MAKGRETKQEVLSEFLDDINEVFSKVEANTATARDYQRLQEYLELSGIEQNLIDSILKEGNFDGWQSFVEQRQKSTSGENIIAVRATLGALRGITRAVIENLIAEINKPD